jgi:hypothetical protein
MPSFARVVVGRRPSVDSTRGRFFFSHPKKVLVLVFFIFFCFSILCHQLCKSQQTSNPGEHPPFYVDPSAASGGCFLLLLLLLLLPRAEQRNSKHQIEEREEKEKERKRNVLRLGHQNFCRRRHHLCLLHITPPLPLFPSAFQLILTQARRHSHC